MNNISESIEMVDEFIKHNLQLKYISEETTVAELQIFIKNIKESYIPLMKNIEKNVKKSYKKNANDKLETWLNKL